MWKFLIPLAICAPSVSSAMDSNKCEVRTFTKENIYLSKVETADKKYLKLAEAKMWTDVLNKGHNHGVNPVVAKTYCAK